MRIPRAVLFPLTHWNWKAALVTAILRGSACIAALHHMSLGARRHFGIVEAAYVLITSGFFTALQQQSLAIRPRKLGWLTGVVAIPVISLSADALLHMWLDQGDMRALGISALFFTIASSTFHWYLMRNGALLVGAESRSLLTDLRQIPGLALAFVSTPFAWLRDAGRRSVEAEEPEVELAA